MSNLMLQVLSNCAKRGKGLEFDASEALNWGHCGNSHLLLYVNMAALNEGIPLKGKNSRKCFAGIQMTKVTHEKNS